MKISEQGILLLKQLEGCVKNGNIHIIYDDKNGRAVNINESLPRGATIGYGHLIKQGEDFRNGISEQFATDLLRADVADAERAVQNNITVSLRQNQYDALVILAYNIGAKNFAESSVVKYINNANYKNNKYQTLESAWKAWNKSCGCIMNGLKNRRDKEWKLFSDNYKE